MQRRIRSGIARLGLAAGLALCASPAFAQAAQWDQQRVTQLATQLAAAVKDLRVEVRKSPDQPPGQSRRAQYQAREDLRLLQYTTQQLASSLAKGEDRDATAPIFQRIQTLRRDAAENGRKGMIPEATLAKIEKARELLDQISPYYAGE
jgi:hypothetical protein